MEKLLEQIEEAYCVLEDFEYLDTDKMEKKDLILYASIMTEFADRLTPLRNKYASHIEDAIAANMFADNAVEGLLNYLNDYEDDEDDEEE